MKKLNNDTLSREEYSEFIQLIQEEKYRDLFLKAMDQDINDMNQEKNTYLIQPSNRRRWIVGLSAAASILVLFLAGVFLLGPLQDEQILTYTTSNGETKDIVLPDNSRVKLNANSKLLWKSGDPNVREVHLSGEAYFNVKHIDSTPFRVFSNDVTIEVLGTSFNVNNRNSADRIYLEEGSVQVHMNKNEKENVVLSPGETAIYDASSTSIVKSIDRKFADQIAWKDGLLKFSNMPAQEILEQLEILYGVQLLMNDTTALDRPVDFTMPYSNWELVSQGLALALGKRVVKVDDHYQFLNR